MTIIRTTNVFWQYLYYVTWGYDKRATDTSEHVVWGRVIHHSNQLLMPFGILSEVGNSQWQLLVIWMAS